MLYELMRVSRKYLDAGESTGSSVNGCSKLSAEGRIKQYREGEAYHHREGDHPSFHFRQEKNFTVELKLSFSNLSVRNPKQEDGIPFWM